MRKALAISMLLMVLALFAVAPAMAAIVFSDDFSGDLSQWTVARGTWAVENGECSQNDTQHSVILAGEDWDNYRVEAKAKRISGIAWVGLLFRALDGNNFYLYGIKDDSFYIGKYVDGTWVKIQGWTETTVDVDVWNTLKVELKGNTIELWLNDNYIGSFTDDWRLSGKIGLASNLCHAHFDDVIVDNPGNPFNAVPEPASVIISVLFFAALASYGLIRKRAGNKTIVTQ